MKSKPSARVYLQSVTSGRIVCYPITATSRFWMCHTICWMVLCQAFLSLLPPPPSSIKNLPSPIPLGRPDPQATFEKRFWHFFMAVIDTCSFKFLVKVLSILWVVCIVHAMNRDHTINYAPRGHLQEVKTVENYKTMQHAKKWLHTVTNTRSVHLRGNFWCFG